MSSNTLPNSDASRVSSKSRLLTPASDSSLNRSKNDALYSSTSRKRKADGLPLEVAKKSRNGGDFNPLEEMLKPSVVVKPYPPNVLVRPRNLQPLMLLPREHLPLAYLDLAAPYGDLHPGRHFESHIKIMELEGRLGSSILVARSEPNGSIYAIEREQRGRYVLCQLGSWVELAVLTQYATAVCRQRISGPASTVTATDAFEPPLTTPQLHKEHKRKKLAIAEIQSIVRKRSISQSVPATATPEQPSAPSQLPTPQEDVTQSDTVKPADGGHAPPAPSLASGVDKVSQAASTDEPLGEQPTADDICQNVRNQYLEALYNSMGSLAYFAKGPLSRARAAFHLDCDSVLEMNDLVDFLRSLVMTTTLLDKKYREAVPGVLEQIKTLIGSDREGAKPKKRKARKMKMGKDGLYTGEDAYIRTWWNSHKPELRDDEVVVKPEEVKYHVSCLRTRETHLQTILILEILALETMHPAAGNGESQLPGMDLKTPPKAAAEAARKRKKQDLPLLADIHADRLCIWQSTTLEEVKALAESQVKNGVSQRSEKPNTDPLKDFCIDIIIPFFSARLPELCDSLNRKFGGPVTVSPPKAKLKRTSSSSKASVKPGSTIKRPPPPKATKSLDQMLAKDRLRRSMSRGPGDAIALLRSATVAPVPGIKREMSEPRSLKGIPRQNSGSLKERPANLLSRSLSMTSTEDTKAKKKALVEAELQDAISALKKPNRGLAGKAIIEDAERRLFRGPTHIRKSKKPVWSPLDKAQVKATPVNNRYRDALTKDNDASFSYALPEIQEPDFIPSSGIRRPPFGWQQSAFLAGHTSTSDNIQATPARRSAVPGRLLKPPAPRDFVPTSSPLQRRHVPQAPISEVRSPSELVPASSPLQGRKSAAVSQPLSSRDVATEATMSSSQGYGATLFETPVKAKSQPSLAADITAMAEAKKSFSIYQQLGWDDDDIDEL